MTQIKVSFKNYKLLKEGEFDLSDGTIFFVQGGNERGKTTFLNLIKSIMSVKDDTKNPVTFGEKDGYATGTITGADGRDYQFRYDFNIDGKNKFQFVDDEGKVIKTITEMRAIFNYTHFTVEEFFDWSKTIPGRAKQREIIMGLLTDKEKDEVNSIDMMINPSSGTLIESRKEVGRDVEFLKKKIDSSIISPDERKSYAMSDDVEKLLLKLTDERSTIETTLLSTKVFEAQIEALNASYNEFVANNTIDVQNSEREIKELEERLTKEKDRLITLTSTAKTRKEDYDNKMKELNEKVDVKLLEDKRKELEVLNDRILKGNAKKEEISRIGQRIESRNKDEQEYVKKKSLYDEYDEKINTLRERKKTIVSMSENIPYGISLDDEGISLDGVPLLESDMAKSRATRIVANIMMKVNQAPFMLMGDAEHLGYEALNELRLIAEENGKMMIFAEHVRDKDSLGLVCFDDIIKDNIENETTTNKLF